jgi:hypothetical protein
MRRELAEVLGDNWEIYNALDAADQVLEIVTRHFHDDYEKCTH